MERVKTRPRDRWRELRAALTVAVQSGDDEEEKKKAAAADQRAQNQRRAEELSPDSLWKKAGLVAIGAAAASLLSRLTPTLTCGLAAVARARRRSGRWSLPRRRLSDRGFLLDCF